MAWVSETTTSSGGNVSLKIAGGYSNVTRNGNTITGYLGLKFTIYNQWTSNTVAGSYGGTKYYAQNRTGGSGSSKQSTGSMYCKAGQENGYNTEETYPWYFSATVSGTGSGSIEITMYAGWTDWAGSTPYKYVFYVPYPALPTGAFNLNIYDPNGTERYQDGGAGTVEFSTDGGSSYTRVYNEPSSSYVVGTNFRFRNFTPGTGMQFSSISGVSGDYGTTSSPWYVSQSSSGTTVNIRTVWQTYTVSYNANGGTGAPASQTKTYGVNLTLSSATPSRVGYSFAGWATSAGGGVAYSPGSTYTGNGPLSLYAVWTVNKYWVNINVWNPSGGEDMDSGIFTQYTSWNDATRSNITDQTDIDTNAHYGSFIDVYNIAPIKSYYELDSVTGYTSIPSAGKYRIVVDASGSQQLNIYMRYKTYTVQYNANEGTSTPSSQSAQYGSNITLANAITRSNEQKNKNITITYNANGGENAPGNSSGIAEYLYSYAFDGWKSSANNAVYGAGATYAMPENGAIMTAQWVETEVGCEIPAAITLSSVTPTRAGYTFVRWATESNVTPSEADWNRETPYKPDQLYNFDRSITLYAVWQHAGCEVYYNANDEESSPADNMPQNLIGDNKLSYGANFTVSSVIPTRQTAEQTPYSFLGWSRTPNGNPQYSGGDSFVLDTTTANFNTANPRLDLYAVWRLGTEHTLAYKNNDIWKRATLAYKMVDAEHSETAFLNNEYAINSPIEHKLVELQVEGQMSDDITFELTKGYGIKSFEYDLSAENELNGVGNIKDELTINTETGEVVKTKKVEQITITADNVNNYIAGNTTLFKERFGKNGIYLSKAALGYQSGWDKNIILMDKYQYTDNKENVPDKACADIFDLDYICIFDDAFINNDAAIAGLIGTNLVIVKKASEIKALSKIDLNSLEQFNTFENYNQININSENILLEYEFEYDSKRKIGATEVENSSTITVNSTKSNSISLDIYGNGLQDGEPTPDTPVEIKALKGWNLLKITPTLFAERTATGITSEILNNGLVRISGTATGSTRYFTSDDNNKIFLEKGTYTLLCNYSGTLRLQIIGATSGTKSNYNGTFTLTEDSYIYNGRISLTSGNNYNEDIYIQLTKGTAALPYLPYNSIGIKRTNDIDTKIDYLDLKGNELLTTDKIVIDDGRYRLIKNWNKIVLNGNEDIEITMADYATENSSIFSLRKFIKDVKLSPNITTIPNIICSHLSANTGINIRNNDINAISVWDKVGNGIIFRVVGLKTIDEVKNWLSSNNITIWYQLAVPQEIDLGWIKTMYIQNEAINMEIISSLVPSKLKINNSIRIKNQGNLTSESIITDAHEGRVKNIKIYGKTERIGQVTGSNNVIYNLKNASKIKYFNTSERISKTLTIDLGDISFTDGALVINMSTGDCYIGKNGESLDYFCSLTAKELDTFKLWKGINLLEIISNGKILDYTCKYISEPSYLWVGVAQMFKKVRKTGESSDWAQYV